MAFKKPKKKKFLIFQTIDSIIKYLLMFQYLIFVPLTYLLTKILISPVTIYNCQLLKIINIL